MTVQAELFVKNGSESVPQSIKKRGETKLESNLSLRQKKTWTTTELLFPFIFSPHGKRYCVSDASERFRYARRGG